MSTLLFILTVIFAAATWLSWFFGLRVPPAASQVGSIMLGIGALTFTATAFTLGMLVESYFK